MLESAQNWSPNGCLHVQNELVGAGGDCAHVPFADSQFAFIAN